MRRFICAVCVVATLAMVHGQANAQIALRGGGGMIFEDSQLGGHASLIVPFSDKPGGLMVAAEYYKKSGFTTIPISLRGLYTLKASAASIYIGIGSGFIYTKQDNAPVNAAAIVAGLGTKALFSAVGGLNLKFSGPLGAFAEMTLDRALTSGANNNWAGKAGISLTFQD